MVSKVIIHSCSHSRTTAAMNNRSLHGSGKAIFIACFENEASVELWCRDQIAWRWVRMAPRPSLSGSMWCENLVVHGRSHWSRCSETFLQSGKYLAKLAFAPSSRTNLQGKSCGDTVACRGFPSIYSLVVPFVCTVR